MSKSMLNPPEREKYNKGKLVKNATKALFDFFGEDASEKQIKSKMEAVHTAVEKAPTGPKKADTLKQVAMDQDLTLQNVKDIEKLYAYKSGGGGKENIFGEVKQVFKALTTKGTSGQLDAEEFGGARTTREARKKAGRIFGFQLGEKVYINPRQRQLKRANNFFEAQFIGPYIHYKVVEGGTAEAALQRAYNGQVVVRYPAEKLLHTETGKIRTLTRKRFRKWAKDDPELLQRFEQEKQKSRALNRYLKEYFERKQK